MTSFTGAVKGGDLLLVGFRSICRGDVARLIESELMATRWTTGAWFCPAVEALWSRSRQAAFRRPVQRQSEAIRGIRHRAHA
jgi:hypothetical protein